MVNNIMKKYLLFILYFVFTTTALFAQTGEKYERSIGSAHGKYALTVAGLQSAIARLDSGVIYIAYPGLWDTTGLGAIPSTIKLNGWLFGKMVNTAPSYFGDDLGVGGDLKIDGDSQIDGDLKLDGVLDIGGHIIPLASDAKQLGSSPNRWNSVWATYFLMGTFPHAAQMFAPGLTQTRVYTFPDANGIVALFDSDSNLVIPGNLDVIGTINNKKIYKALLTQSSTNAPVAIVKENSIGSIVWTYDGVGSYIGTLSGAFLVDKVLSQCTFTSISGSETIISLGRTDDNSITLIVKDNASSGTDVWSMSVAITVYP